MSSEKRKLLRYSPSIFKPLVSQASRRNMLSRASVNNLKDMVTPLLMLILLLSLCRSSSCWYKIPSGVRCTDLLSPVLEARSVLLEFALSRKLSRSRRMRCRVGYYIICTCPSVGLRRGCGLLLSILNPTCSRGWFSWSVYSSLFVSTFLNTL